MDEVRIDLRKIGEDERQKREQQEWLLFRLNHTFYLEPGYKELMRELFAGKIGENSRHYHRQIRSYRRSLGRNA